MAQEMRYTVTLDMYVYDVSDEAVKKQVKIIEDAINNLKGFEGNTAKVLTIHETEWGTIGQAREIK